MNLGNLAMRLEMQAKTQEQNERVLEILIRDPGFAKALVSWKPGNVFINLTPLSPETIREVSALNLEDPVPDVPDVQTSEDRAAGIPNWFQRLKRREAEEQPHLI